MCGQVNLGETRCGRSYLGQELAVVAVSKTELHLVDNLCSSPSGYPLHSLYMACGATGTLDTVSTGIKRGYTICKIYRQRHLLRTAYFSRGWRLIDRPKPSTCSYLPCSYLTIRLPPRCSGCLFLFQYSMSTCHIMLCSTVCCAVQQ